MVLEEECSLGFNSLEIWRSLAAREREHGPRFRYHVPRSENVDISKTGMFLFSRYKIIPQVPVFVPEMGTGTWMLRGDPK